MSYHLPLKKMQQLFRRKKFNHKPCLPAGRSSIIHHKLGFTLIELLIVVAIIGILSALLMTNFIGIRQRARDAQRKADIRQIQAALELYRADQGSYKSANGNELNTASCPTSSALKSDDGSTTYMNQIPCDPLGISGTYNSGNYYYNVTSGGYMLAACLENTADTDFVTNGAQVATGITFNGGDSNCTSGHYFVKTNP